MQYNADLSVRFAVEVSSLNELSKLVVERIVEISTGNQHLAISIPCIDDNHTLLSIAKKYVEVAQQLSTSVSSCLRVVEMGEFYAQPSLILELPNDDCVPLNLRLHENQMNDLDSDLCLIRAVASVIREVHSANIAMRVVTPDKFVISNGRVLLRDLGAAERSGSSISTLSFKEIDQYLDVDSEYRSPERLHEELNIDAIRSDVYAFGVIAYEILTGHRPYVGKRERLRWEMQHIQPVSIRQLRPDCPDDVANLLHRCLSVVPSDRPRNLIVVDEQLAVLANSPSLICNSIPPLVVKTRHLVVNTPQKFLSMIALRCRDAISHASSSLPAMKLRLIGLAVVATFGTCGFWATVGLWNSKNGLNVDSEPRSQPMVFNTTNGLNVDSEPRSQPMVFNTTNGLNVDSEPRSQPLVVNTISPKRGPITVALTQSASNMRQKRRGYVTFTWELPNWREAYELLPPLEKVRTSQTVVIMPTGLQPVDQTFCRMQATRSVSPRLRIDVLPPVKWFEISVPEFILFNSNGNNHQFTDIALARVVSIPTVELATATPPELMSHERDLLWQALSEDNEYDNYGELFARARAMQQCARILANRGYNRDALAMQVCTVNVLRGLDYYWDGSERPQILDADGTRSNAIQRMLRLSDFFLLELLVTEDLSPDFSTRAEDAFADFSCRGLSTERKLPRDDLYVSLQSAAFLGREGASTSERGLAAHLLKRCEDSLSRSEACDSQISQPARVHLLWQIAARWRQFENNDRSIACLSQGCLIAKNDAAPLNDEYLVVGDWLADYLTNKDLLADITSNDWLVKTQSVTREFVELLKPSYANHPSVIQLEDWLAQSPSDPTIPSSVPHE